MVKDLLAEVTAFVQQVYLPDVCVIGAKYAEWLKYGAGVTNYLAVPDLPSTRRGRSSTSPGGRSSMGSSRRTSRSRPSRIRTSRRTCREHRPVLLRRGVGETPVGGATVPKAGEFIPSGSTRGRSPRGSRGARCRWAPRPGPDGVRRRPRADDALGNRALETASKAAGAKLGPSHLHSTLGRHLARAVRCAVLGSWR